MSEAIVFTSGKGGVGKTTVISNIGVELSQLDKKVIMLDTDMGLRNLDLVMGIEDKVNYNILDILNRSCRIRQAIIRNKKYPNLYVIPAAPSMDTLCSYEARFKILIEELKASFDYCLIDSPAGIDSGFWFSVSPADRAIVVTTPHVSAIHDARRCISLLDSAHLDDISVIVNAYDKHMVRRHQMISDNAHDEDEHHEEEERHQDLGDALDALFNAEVDDEGGGAEEGEVREHGGDVGGGEGLEGAAHHGRIVDDAVAHEGLNHVVDAPAAHHGVEGEHEEAREHGDVSDDAREGAAEPSEGACGACAYRAAHAHLADEKREADRHGEEDVGEHEDGAAVRASHVGKLPNGTETDGGACARENKPQAGPPY